MKFVFSITLLFFAVMVFAQHTVQGYVHDELTKAPLKGTKITLSILDSITYYPERFDSLMLVAFNYDARYDTTYKRLKDIRTDTNGYYLLDSLPAGIYELGVFHATREIRPNAFEGEFDIKRGIKLCGDCASQFSFVLHVTCEYDKTKDLKYCPKCLKKDKVRPIVYGYPLPEAYQDPNFFYNGYCVIPRCHPTKHCLRCNYDF